MRSPWISGTRDPSYLRFLLFFLQLFVTLLFIRWVNKSRIARWVGHIARRPIGGNQKYVYICLSEIMKRRHHSENLNIDGNIILKYSQILEKYVIRVWNVFNQVTKGYSGNEASGSLKGKQFSTNRAVTSFLSRTAPVSQLIICSLPAWREWKWDPCFEWCRQQGGVFGLLPMIRIQ